MATKFGNMKHNGYSSPNRYHRTNLKSLLGSMIHVVLRMEATSCVFKVQENVHTGIDIMSSDISVVACFAPFLFSEKTTSLLFTITNL